MGKTRSGLPASVLRPHQTRPLAQLEQAERMLAEVASVEEAVRLASLAETARVLAKESHLGTEAVNHATTIKLRAERRLADIVDEGQARGEIAGRGKPSESEALEAKPTTLQELGVLPRKLHEARLIRDSYTEGDIQSLAEDASTEDRILSRDRLLRKARDEKAARVREEKQRRTETAKATPRLADLRHGDFRTVLADLADGSVDAIITDPPYPREFLPLFGDLAEFADRVLVPDGVLVVLSGQTHLPDVFEQLSGYRPYRWTACYQTPGAGYASHARRVQSNWKPVLVYGGGPRFGDVFSASADDKQHHHWGQDFSAFSAIVERLSEPEALICDPFLGGGTTAAAALSLGRRFVGSDVDADAVATALERVA